MKDQNIVTPFTSYQKFVVAVLAFMQFTIILDFMILSPLGAIMMPALNMTTAQFGMVVSAYAFSAGTAGLLAAGFADRFDRKKLLLFFYVGFLVGTLLCALAPTYSFLLMARMVTGLFGGVIGSVIFAITTDLFTYDMRGRVMGYVQTAFASSQILGIPAGLYFSNLWGWHAPFLMIVIVGLIVGAVIFFYLRPINEHLKLPQEHNAFQHLRTTLTTPKYLLAFSATALLSIGGFMLMPFGSAFTVNNLGVHIEKLPLVYLITGLCAMVTGPVVGRMADRFGKFRIFVFGTILSIIMVIYYTHMGISSLMEVVVVNAILFVGVFSRMIPSQAMMSAIPAPASRGSFMSVSSSLQQISGGVAALAAGMIVVQTKEGLIEHFDTLGFVIVGTTTITLVMMYLINRLVSKQQGV